MPHANYPATVAEVLGNVRYKMATKAAVRAFSRSKPWRGTLDERKQKFLTLHQTLCRIYAKRTQLELLIDESQHSGSSCFIPSDDKIVLRGRLSVVTYLHEFGHALGKDERQTCRWSINLFRRYFPRSFSRAGRRGHTLERVVQFVTQEPTL